MKSLVRILCLLALLSTACLGWAETDLYGSHVTGVLNFNGVGINWFDPANGFVPSGYGNSSPNGPANVLIGDVGEFAFFDGANFILVNFTHSDMIITDFSNGQGLAPTHMTFEDPIFAGLQFDSSNFPGSVSASIAGDIITVDFSGFTGHSGLYTANWEITQDQVPEPGTLATLASGLIGAAAFARRRWLI